MNQPTSETTTLRAASLFDDSLNQIHQRADRLFAKLMLVQWVAGIAAALWISPRTWIGTYSYTHWHVWAAVLLGGAITSFPVFLAWTQPGRPLTRHVIAVGQMLTSALLIHLTGGRIETHFHVFGSLAFFAFYRDWRVLATATVVVAVDHAARGIFWPQSVFGVLTSSPWRWLEHAGWVLFEDTFLVISIQQSLSDMREVASRRAHLETVNAQVELQVRERTAELTKAHLELQSSEQRFRKLSASSPIGIFETDPLGNTLYTNLYWQNITGLSLADSLGEGWKKAVHPDDAQELFETWERAAREGREFNGEFRFRRANGEVRWVRARSAVTRSRIGQVTGHVGTVEDITERRLADLELEKANQELLATSRMAGMAEVATGVLHNVGNVLNSVNVSATVVMDKLKKSKSSSLEKAVSLLREHETDLGKFMTDDPRGQRLPGYLARLAQHLATEESASVKELAQLQKNIEHIKDIVAMQQNYAKVSGVVESLATTELVEDALRIDSTPILRNGIVVNRDFQEVPPILLEKHKVLQILVNLIRNAVYACSASERVNKELTVQVRQEDGFVKIAVIDNGVGIAREDLTRIFVHGFTTKKEGHGFGLHSGAIAAKEMGGSLHVQSEGLGHGATFTLRLPMQMEKRMKSHQADRLVGMHGAVSERMSA